MNCILTELCRLKLGGPVIMPHPVYTHRMFMNILTGTDRHFLIWVCSTTMINVVAKTRHEQQECFDITRKTPKYNKYNKYVSVTEDTKYHLTSSSSSRMRVMNQNWSATRQRLHPQSVAKISCHSVLSGRGSCVGSVSARSLQTEPTARLWVRVRSTDVYRVISLGKIFTPTRLG